MTKNGFVGVYSLAETSGMTIFTFQTKNKNRFFYLFIFLAFGIWPFFYTTKAF